MARKKQILSTKIDDSYTVDEQSVLYQMVRLQVIMILLQVYESPSTMEGFQLLLCKVTVKRVLTQFLTLSQYILYYWTDDIGFLFGVIGFSIDDVSDSNNAFLKKILIVGILMIAALRKEPMAENLVIALNTWWDEKTLINLSHVLYEGPRVVTFSCLTGREGSEIGK
jgi:hypothetical protein